MDATDVLAFLDAHLPVLMASFGPSPLLAACCRCVVGGAVRKCHVTSALCLHHGQGPVTGLTS